MDELFYSSRYWQWYCAQEDLEGRSRQRLRAEGLALLVECIRIGEITSLDGINSPLSRQIEALHGRSSFEMNSNWAGTSQEWCCPCCGRSKLQISRVGHAGQILAKLVVHHDHMDDALKAAFHHAFASAGTEVAQAHGLQLVERIGGSFSAYEPVLVCEDCNNADTRAKQLANTPERFSFSISQISSFIRSADHRPHDLDQRKVVEAWQAAQPAYTLRMQLIDTVAHAAATDRHWYEPSSHPGKAIPVFAYTRRLSDSAIEKWVGGDELFAILAPRRTGIPDFSRWRKGPAKLRKIPPANFVAMVCSDPIMAREWQTCPDEWCCPICSRTKRDTVYVGDKGKVFFQTRPPRPLGAWKSMGAMCNDCHAVLIALKREVVQAVGPSSPDSYEFVTPAELRSLLATSSHCPHSVNEDAARNLVERLVFELTNR